MVDDGVTCPHEEIEAGESRDRRRVDGVILIGRQCDQLLHVLQSTHLATDLGDVRLRQGDQRSWRVQQEPSVLRPQDVAACRIAVYQDETLRAEALQLLLPFKRQGEA